MPSSQDRVDVKPGQDGGLAIVNGLPWELEAVLVADASGRLLSARNVLPNASEPLADVSETNRSDFVRLLGRNRPELPDNFSSPVLNPLVGRRLRPFNDDEGCSERAFRFEPDGAADSNVVRRPSAKKTCLSPRSFLAVLRQNPGVDTGVGLTTEQAGYHLLLGYY